MKYKIVSHISTLDLEGIVNSLLADGWKPVGGLTYQYDGGAFYQALVQEEE